MSHLEKTLAAIQDRHLSAIEEVLEFRGETTVVISVGALFDVCKMLRDDPELDYNFLSDLAAVDYYPQEPRFSVAYLPYSMRHNARFRIKVLVTSSVSEVPTLTGIWPGADWPEREAWDLMGIKFTGHPDPRRILMPADWDGHPHRKDYPLGYEEVQFSFNAREIDSRKFYAEE